MRFVSGFYHCTNRYSSFDTKMTRFRNRYSALWA